MREYLTTAHMSGTLLLTVVNNVLDFSKLEARKMLLSVHEMDLRECIEESLETVAYKVEEKKLEIGLSMQKEIPYMVYGDCPKIQQILNNILMNAAKFTERGYIHVHVCRVGHSYNIAVKDTGIGISCERLEEIFKEFHQLPTGNLKGDGVGLGLRIAKTLAEMMGGTIHVESTVGVGSTFTIQLPISPLDHQTASEKVLHLPNHQVLIVEPSLLSERIFSELLAEMNLHAIFVRTIEELLAILSISPHQFAALVIRSPDLGGRVTFEMISGIAGQQNLPIIMETTRNEIPNSANYLNQPITPRKLRHIFQSFVQAPTALPGIVLSTFPTKRPDKPCSVLVVDDNLVNQKVMQRTLVKLGFDDITVVPSGEDAIELVSSGKEFDVILMDIRLPTINGIQATHILRKKISSGKKQPYVIAQSSTAEEELRSSCREAEFDDYIEKPYPIGKLITALSGFDKELFNKE